MTPYTFDHATPETLDAYMAFRDIQNPEDFRARLADGRLTYEGLLQMHSGRDLEAAWTHGPSPVIFPSVRLDLEPAGLEAFARQLAHTAPDRRVILNGGLAPTDSAPWEAAGWVLDTHSVMAQTDLTARSWPLDPRVQERAMSDLLAPDLLELYAELLTAGRIRDLDETDPATAFEEDLRDEHKRLFALMEGQTVLGAAVLIPDQRGAGIQMLGVRPDGRGQGLGLALHAHLLSVASQDHRRHGGTTDWDNHAMRRIFGRNGAVLSEQKQVVWPARPGLRSSPAPLL